MGVEVVVHGCLELALELLDGLNERRLLFRVVQIYVRLIHGAFYEVQGVPQPCHGVLSDLHGLLGVVKGPPVVDGEVEVPERLCAVLGEDVVEADVVPQALGHLRAIYRQEPDVEPIVDEGLPCEALGLGDLVLVVGECQVLASGVDVDGVPHQAAAHDTALYVPAGAPPAPG